MKRFYGDILVIFCLIVIVLAFFWPGLSGKKVFFGADEIASDIAHLVYPHYAFIYGKLASGKISLWNPYAGSGSPLMGESQTGIYYPIQVLLYLFLPPYLALNWLIISAFAVAAVATYLYTRSLGLVKIAAFFSALSFTFSGFMIGQVRHVPVIIAAAFLPLMFLVCERIIKNPRLVWSAALALLVFLAFAPGHLTTSYLLILMLVAYFLVRLWFVFGREKEESLRPVVIFLAGLFLGVVASAGTLLPAVEMIGYSNRANFSLENSLNPIYKLKYLLMFINPYIFGDPSRGTWDMRVESFWENIGYIGILPLILAIWAAFLGIRRKNLYILGITLFTLFNFFLLFGNGTFLYGWVRDWIPGFSYTRVPGRFLLFIDLFLSVLAGYGLMFLLSSVRGLRRQIVVFGVIVFTLVDLYKYGSGFNAFLPIDYYSATNTVKYLQKDPDLYRIRQIGFEEAWQNAWVIAGGWRGDLTAYMNQRELLPPDLNMVFGISTSDFLYGGSGRYGVKRSIELDGAVANSLSGPNRARTSVLMGMENVKYLLLPIRLEGVGGFEEAASLPRGETGDRTYIYKNNNWLPRAFMVGRAIYAQDAGIILDALNSVQFDPRSEVILEKKVNKPETSIAGKVAVDKYSDDRVELTADSDAGGFLVLSDTYYPGWKAAVDGQQTEILKANYAYRAVYLEKGKHKVVFSYEPDSIRIGAYITFGTLFVILEIFVWDLKFFKKRRQL